MVFFHPRNGSFLHCGFENVASPVSIRPLPPVFAVLAVNSECFSVEDNGVIPPPATTNAGGPRRDRVELGVVDVVHEIELRFVHYSDSFGSATVSSLFPFESKHEIRCVPACFHGL